MTQREDAYMSWDDAERRVADIFGLQEGEALPGVSRHTLRTYHAYLRAHVKFPFKAKVEDLDGDATMQSLFALKECPDLTFYGLFVRGHHQRSLIEIPIGIIEEVKGKGPNKQLIEDYCLWFWNCR
jgi:hypothetical protein